MSMPQTTYTQILKKIWMFWKNRETAAIVFKGIELQILEKKRFFDINWKITIYAFWNIN